MSEITPHPDGKDRSPNPFLKLLKRPQKDRPVLDLTMTVGEVVADTVMKGDLLEAIPFVNLAMKAVKAKDTIADGIYAAKLVSFVNGIGDLSPAERAKAAKRYTEDGDSAVKAGETVLLVLNRLTDLDKPALLGHLFRCFAVGEITTAQLMRLAVAIDGGFPDDLIALLQNQQPPSWMQDCYRRLTHTGLTAIYQGLPGNTISAHRNSYHLTDNGVLLYKLVNRTEPNDPIEGGNHRLAG